MIYFVSILLLAPTVWQISTNKGKSKPKPIPYAILFPHHHMWSYFYAETRELAQNGYKITRPNAQCQRSFEHIVE